MTSDQGETVAVRSWLFVPSDSERKQARALASGADALILDLEDSVAPARLAPARERIGALLRERHERAAQRLWVRVNGLASGELLADLAAVMGGAPDGIVLPKAESAAGLVELHHYLSALEARESLPAGSTRVVVIATETPGAVLGAAGYREAAPRLAGLTWGAEDLGAALGARAKTDDSGAWTPVFEHARSQCLLAAAAAGVPAIDGVHAEFRDGAGLSRALARARRDGFCGKLAIHPDQIEAINAAFTPTETEVSQARRIVAAFAETPDVGVTSIDGRMVDRPHLALAQRMLAAAERLVRK
jgi:citrate lyase subunit beta/citryl-CoA lyase